MFRLSGGLASVTYCVFFSFKNQPPVKSEKEYYIELSDNYTGGWGLIRADGFTIITVEEANKITSGDRAVSIGGIVTNYTYVLPYNV